jgi:polysaccharide chain length determinant protein (PEP-CTERM system associated)
MNQMLASALSEVRGAWRFRWWGLAAAWALCALGWSAVIGLPNTYEADARVYVDSRSILRPLLQGLTINPDVASELDLVRQALLSRPRLEKVAHATDLDIRARTQQARDALIASLQRRILIEAADSRARSTAGEGLYKISFRDSSRDKSLAVVKTLLNAFVEDTLGSKRTGQETAQRFLDEQIADHEKRLSEAEARLSAFKKKNVGTMPDQRGDYYSRLQQEETGLEQARGALALAESRREEIGRQLQGEEPFFIGFDSNATGGPANDAARGGDLTYRIQDLEKKLDELLLRYTDKHPEVIATRDTIEELKRRQAEELARVRARQPATGSLSSSLKSNPVYQNLQLEQKRTEVQVAELRQDVAQRQSRVAELKRLVNTVPEVEAELTRLNRDYEVTHSQYVELVKRRETANLSEDADRTGTVKFDVIDPPVVGFDPVAPNRPLLLTVVLLGALAVGAGLTYLLNRTRPVFQDVRSLAEITGLPVLAAVSRTWLARHMAAVRRDSLKLSGAALLLLVAFSTVMIWHETGARLFQRLLG